MKDVLLCAVAAMAENRVIGDRGGIPWHIPEDFRHFKKTTGAAPMIMGRKTFESLPGILKGRTHIVVSRAGFEHPEALAAPDVDRALDMARTIARAQNQDRISIIGGGEIFRQTMDIIDLLYLTVVHREYEGDAFFPEFDWKNWRILEQDRREGDPAFTFYTLERK